MQGLTVLLSGAKQDANERRQRAVRRKAGKYFEFAEGARSKLQAQLAAAPPASGGDVSTDVRGPPHPAPQQPQQPGQPQHLGQPQQPYPTHAPAAAVQEASSEASNVDMGTDASHPPTEFAHAAWCSVRDQLWRFGQPHPKEDPRGAL